MLQTGQQEIFTPDNNESGQTWKFSDTQTVFSSQWGQLMFFRCSQLFKHRTTCSHKTASGNRWQQFGQRSKLGTEVVEGGSLSPWQDPSRPSKILSKRPPQVFPCFDQNKAESGLAGGWFLVVRTVPSKGSIYLHGPLQRHANFFKTSTSSRKECLTCSNGYESVESNSRHLPPDILTK
jgi:hypothetical protein